MDTEERMWYQGQSLVLVALSAVVLIGLVALAIDGGYFYSQRRSAQNAADGGSIAGTVRLIRQRDQNQLNNQTQLLTTIVQAAQVHGVPDTDGNPTNEVNTNVQAFYMVRDPGQPYVRDCQVGLCNPVDPNAWGVHVNIVKPTQTFFAGILGWNSANIGAWAEAVIRESQTADNGQYWAVLADNQRTCDSGVMEIDIAGPRISVEGNSHANGDFRFNGPDTVSRGGEMTFSSACHNAATGSNSPTQCIGLIDYDHEPEREDQIGIVYPNYNAYRDFAQDPGNVTMHVAGDLVVDIDDTHIGEKSTDEPEIVWVEGGDFVVSGVGVQLYGLFFVEGGNVIISGANLSGDYTIITNGTVQVTSTATNLLGEAYYDRQGIWPLLDAERNVAVFYTTATAANDPCTMAVIQVDGPNANITGAVLAPNGQVLLTGAPTNVNGTVIGNTVRATGTQSRFEYNARYFPPQPDRIELVE